MEHPGFVAPFLVDDSGQAYYKWPPFPVAPPGVHIINLKDFEPVGIAFEPDADGNEVCCEGQRTTELRVRHGLDKDSSSKKRKRKGGKIGGLLAEKLTWNEEWEESDESHAKTLYDPRTDRRERLAAASSDFQADRKWSSHLQSIHDHWRQFIGLMSHPNQRARLTTRNGKLDGAGADAASEHSEDDDELEFEKPVAESVGEMVPPPSVPPPETTIEPADEEDDLAALVLEERQDAFLDDVECSVKTFLTSYFVEKGLFWTKANLKDGPMLIDFFLKFLDRNRVFSGEEKTRQGLSHAIDELLPRAKKELPATAVIGYDFPDKWNGGCRALFGNVGEAACRLKHFPVDASAVESEPATTVKDLSAAAVTPLSTAVPTPKPMTPEPDLATFARDEGLIAISADDLPPEAMDVDVNGTGQDMLAGGWGNNDGGGWGAADNAWATDADAAPDHSAWDAGGDAGMPLERARELLGARADALRPVRAECGLRYVVRVEAPGNADGLGGALGTVVLAPWPAPSASKAALTAGPEMWFDRVAEGTAGVEVPPHNEHVDEILVYAEAEWVAKLSPGLGLKGVFVHVVDAPETDGSPAEPVAKKRRKGKGKEKVAPGFWYIESLVFNIPSFWTEME